MLKRIRMPRSTYYYNVAHLDKADNYSVERERISEIFAQHHKRYGYRRVCQQLRCEGYLINHKTVQRLMREMHLKSVVRKVRYRSYKGDAGCVAPNVLQRDFVATAPTANGRQMSQKSRLGTGRHTSRQYWICSMERLSPIQSPTVQTCVW